MREDRSGGRPSPDLSDDEADDRSELSPSDSHRDGSTAQRGRSVVFDDEAINDLPPVRGPLPDAVRGLLLDASGVALSEALAKGRLLGAAHGRPVTDPRPGRHRAARRTRASVVVARSAAEMSPDDAGWFNSQTIPRMSDEPGSDGRGPSDNASASPVETGADDAVATEVAERPSVASTAEPEGDVPSPGKPHRRRRIRAAFGSAAEASAPATFVTDASGVTSPARVATDDHSDETKELSALARRKEKEARRAEKARRASIRDRAAASGAPAISVVVSQRGAASLRRQPPQSPAAPLLDASSSPDEGPKGTTGEPTPGVETVDAPVPTPPEDATDRWQVKVAVINPEPGPRAAKSRKDKPHTALATAESQAAAQPSGTETHPSIHLEATVPSVPAQASDVPVGASQLAYEVGQRPRGGRRRRPIEPLVGSDEARMIADRGRRMEIGGGAFVDAVDAADFLSRMARQWEATQVLRHIEIAEMAYEEALAETGRRGRALKGRAARRRKAELDGAIGILRDTHRAGRVDDTRP